MRNQYTLHVYALLYPGQYFNNVIPNVYDIMLWYYKYNTLKIIVFFNKTYKNVETDVE